jgi:hypothetical protein
VLKRVFSATVPSSCSRAALELNPSVRGEKPAINWPSCFRGYSLMHSAVTSTCRSGTALFIDCRSNCSIVPGDLSNAESLPCNSVERKYF